MTSETSGTGREPARSCAECGTRAEPGQSFCDSCGSVLGWSGGRDRTDAARTDAAPRDAVRTDAVRAGATAPARGSTAEGTTGDDPAWDAFARPGSGTGTARTGRDRTAAALAAARRAAAEPPSSDEPDEREPTEPVEPDQAAARRDRDGTPPTADAAPVVTAPTEPVPAATPSPDSPDSSTERARSLLVPVSDPEPQAPETPDVAPVLPGRPVAMRPQVRTPGPEFGAQGGIPCPWCATPNRPDRHYCGRCAMPMAGGPEGPARPQPWWRRIPPFRAERTPWAGDRPRLRRGFGRVMNWVVGALVITLIVTLAFHIDDGIQATRDHFAKRAPVGPDSVKASRSYPDHGAKLAFDKINNSWWGPGVTQSGEGEWLEAEFDQPTRLLDLIITPGVSTKADQLQQSALPHRIEARITQADGTRTTRTITLDQAPGGQRRKFRVGDVTAVRFIIRSAYGADAKKQVAIAEIEFFGRSSSNT